MTNTACFCVSPSKPRSLGALEGSLETVTVVGALQPHRSHLGHLGLNQQENSPASPQPNKIHWEGSALVGTLLALASLSVKGERWCVCRVLFFLGVDCSFSSQLKTQLGCEVQDSFTLKPRTPQCLFWNLFL